MIVSTEKSETNSIRSVVWSLSGYGDAVGGCRLMPATLFNVNKAVLYQQCSTAGVKRREESAYGLT